MNRAALWAAAYAAAFWPVWLWQVKRMQDGSDEPWGILALLTVIVYMLMYGRPQSPNKIQSCCAAAIALTYAATFSALPPLVRALLVVMVMSLVLSSWNGSRTIHFALLGLLTLSLPIVASLQFYLGYPVRLVTAALAAGVLTLVGFPTEASGTALNWCGETIIVDAPCAGIRMLWIGLYVAFTGALFRRFGFFTTWVSYSLATIFIFVGNLLRNILLFFTESKIIVAPEWMHGAIGIFCLGLVAIAILCSQELITSRAAYGHS